MKLLRHGPVGEEKPGLLDGDGVIRDLSGVIGDISPQTLGPGSIDRLKELDPGTLPAVPGSPRLGPCVGGIGKLVCIGLNYSDHAAETGSRPPPEPIIFMKANSAISGPNDDVRIPRGSVKTDWEVELGVVIGTQAKYVSEADALDHVAGYCICNGRLRAGVPGRAGRTVDQGKELRHLRSNRAMAGDRRRDPGSAEPEDDARRQRHAVPGRKHQHDDLRRPPPRALPFAVLHPVSGRRDLDRNPPGVGLGIKPEPVFLKPGDEMRLTIEGLGEQRQKCVAD